MPARVRRSRSKSPSRRSVTRKSPKRAVKKAVRKTRAPRVKVSAKRRAQIKKLISKLSPETRARLKMLSQQYASRM